MPYTEHWIALICPLTGQQVFLLSVEQNMIVKLTVNLTFPVYLITSHCHDPAEKQKYICLSYLCLPMQHVCMCVITKLAKISVRYDITDTHGHTTT